jgi:hypothetical protein
MYPELRGDWTRTRITLRIQVGVDVDEAETKTTVSVSIWDGFPEPEPESGRDAGAFVLGGDLSFFRDGRLMRYGAGGWFLNEGRNDAFSAFIDRHPKWSQRQLAVALKNAGARFGPENRTAFLRRIPLRELERFLGKNLKLERVWFSFNEPGSGRGRSAWAVHLLGTGPAGKPSNYFLVFEPFDGRLVQIGNRREDFLQRSQPIARSPDADPLETASARRGADCIQSFLALAYPELMTQRVNAVLASDEPFDATWSQLRAVRFALWDDPPRKGIPTVNPFDERNPYGYNARLLMQGHVELDDTGRLNKFAGRDSFALNSGKNADLRGAIEARFKGTIEEGLETLKEARPRFGPDQQDAFLQSIPLRLLEAFLGKLTLQSVKFDTMWPGNEWNPAVGYFQWHVVVQAQRPGEAPYQRVLHFEPFGGKLTEIRSPEYPW